MKEIFKDIPDYEGFYQVSNFGNVKSLSRKISWNNTIKTINEKILSGRDDGKGYKCVLLNKNGINKSFKIHQLVAIVFLGHNRCGHKVVVDHINNIKYDNRVENLQLISNRENCSKDKIKKSGLPVGVVYHKKNMRYQAQIRYGFLNKYLGQYNTIEEASEAYQKALKELLKVI